MPSASCMWSGKTDILLSFPNESRKSATAFPALSLSKKSVRTHPLRFRRGRCLHRSTESTAYPVAGHMDPALQRHILARRRAACPQAAVHRGHHRFPHGRVRAPRSTDRHDEPPARDAVPHVPSDGRLCPSLPRRPGKKSSISRKKYLHFEKTSTIIAPLTGYAPLAQLVEHLTLNQGVQGSSP